MATSLAEWDMDTTALGDPRGYLYALDTVEMETDARLRGMIKDAILEDMEVAEGPM